MSASLRSLRFVPNISQTSCFSSPAAVAAASWAAFSRARAFLFLLFAFASGGPTSTSSANRREDALAVATGKYAMLCYSKTCLKARCVLCAVSSAWAKMATEKKLGTLFDLCVSSLRRGHANLLCIVPILSDDPRRESSASKKIQTRWHVFCAKKRDSSSSWINKKFSSVLWMISAWRRGSQLDKYPDGHDVVVFFGFWQVLFP